MTYRYDEPIHAADGVLFRIYDHEQNNGQQSYLFKVSQQALKDIAGVDNRLDEVDIYNQHRDAIHKIAVGLISAGATHAKINDVALIITTQMLNKF